MDQIIRTLQWIRLFGPYVGQVSSVEAMFCSLKVLFLFFCSLTFGLGVTLREHFAPLFYLKCVDQIACVKWS